MGLRVVDCADLMAAWMLANKSQATQAFDPWYEKLVNLARYNKTKLLLLMAHACDEADQKDRGPRVD